MITTALQSLKGGTGKTVTAQNLAYNLSQYHKKRVLLVDCDPQGNTAFSFGLDGRQGTAALLEEQGMNINDVIYDTPYKRLRVIPGSMDLYTAERAAYESGQVYTLRHALQEVAAEYDFCIIDAAPALNMAVVNALVAADSIVVPLRVDDFSREGLKNLREQIGNAQAANSRLYVLGCLVTHWQRNDVNIQGEAYIKGEVDLSFFDSRIRYSSRLPESTFYRKPLAAINCRSGATIDYRRFTREYLVRIGQE